MIPDNVNTIMKKLEANNFQVEIVGGAVRDSFQGKIPNDWDLFTNANGEEILKLFPGKILGGEERQKKILTVIYDGVEISSYRGCGDRTKIVNTIEEHIKSCDFTINALYKGRYSKIMDLVGGINDIQLKILRTVGEPKKTFDDDLLRVLRALRFEAQGFIPSDKLRLIIRKYIPKLKTLPVDRIREEMIKIIKEKNGISLLQGYGFFNHLIPELEFCRDIDGGNYHAENIYEHSIKSFEATKQVTNDKRIWLASLFHDIGKVVTKMEDENGIHFYGHEFESVIMANKILKRFNFSKADTDFICALIESHMFGYSKDLTDKGIVKFIAKLNKAKINIWDWLALRYGDNQGNQKNVRVKPYDFQYRLIEDYYRIKYSNIPITVKDLQISGKDLLELGYPKSKIIGDKLNEVFQKVMDGELDNSRPELMKYIRRSKK